MALALRRLPPLKFVFNLMQFVFATALGYVVVHVIAGPGAEFGPRVWLGVLVALQLGGLVTIALISAAMWMTEGSLSREQVRQMFGDGRGRHGDEHEPRPAARRDPGRGAASGADRADPDRDRVRRSTAPTSNERQRHEKLEFL